MRELFLLRHAHASNGEPNDHERPLSARGRVEAAQIGEQLRSMGAAVSLALCSSALRTRETLQALRDSGAVGAGSMRAPLETRIEAGMYLASARQMLERLRLVPAAASCALLIAHNPGISELAVQLVGLVGRVGEGDRDSYDRLRAGMPTGALCRLEFAADWADLAPGAARLIAFNLPKPFDSSTLE